MKKIISIIGLSFVCIFVVMLSITTPTFAQTITEETAIETTENEDKSEFTKFIEDKIIPVLMSGCLVVVGIATALAPIIKLANTLKQAKLEASENNNKLKETISTNTVLATENKKLIKILEENNKKIKENQEILKKGFGNLKELVVNGYASDIAKVGTNETNSKDTATTN